MRHQVEWKEGSTICADITGAGQPVVLLHGIPGSGAVWGEVADRLAADHQVIVPDLLGFGASSRTDRIEELWADNQAEAVAALLADLGVEKAILVGHDYGGPVVSHLIGRNPGVASALVLAATNAFGDTPVPFPLSGIFLPLVGGLWQQLLFSAPSLRMMVRQGTGPQGPALAPERYVGDGPQARAIAVIFGTALRELAARYTPITEHLRTVTVPTTVLWGDRDPFFPAEHGRRTAELIPGAKFILLEEAGHFLPEERPAELAAAIQEFSAPAGQATARTDFEIRANRPSAEAR